MINSILSGLLLTRVSQNGEKVIFTLAILLSLSRREVASLEEVPAMSFPDDKICKYMSLDMVYRDIGHIWILGIDHDRISS